jgi:hypothetical protein
MPKNKRLRVESLPRPDAPWEEIEQFCLTFDGYADGKRSVEECARIAVEVMEGSPELATAEDIRIALFFWQRKARWNDGYVDPADDRSASACIEVLRRRLAGEPA